MNNKQFWILLTFKIVLIFKTLSFHIQRKSISDGQKSTRRCCEVYKAKILIPVVGTTEIYWHPIWVPVGNYGTSCRWQCMYVGARCLFFHPEICLFLPLCESNLCHASPISVSGIEIGSFGFAHISGLMDLLVFYDRSLIFFLLPKVLCICNSLQRKRETNQFGLTLKDQVCEKSWLNRQNGNLFTAVDIFSSAV